ncbi:MAG: PIG-L family deacetylase [Candidatus Aenigmarchaeota archaeon]|nr:PIG-L family deacetylase [Candidatus Aenigmarchaeota archaeon]
MSDKTVLFVGTHPDDIEIGCGGTIQVFRSNGIDTVGLIITTGHDREDARRRDAVLKSSDLLGYTPEFGNILSIDLTDILVEDAVAKLIGKYHPIAVFGHSRKDSHRSHKIVSDGTDSAARYVRNRLHYAGPEGEYEFSPNVFFTFTEKEFNGKLKALKIHQTAYGDARYFHENYLTQNSWLGQRVLQYTQRENAPYVLEHGDRHIPYAEGFEARHIVNPALSDSLFFDSEMRELAKTVGGTDI